MIISSFYLFATPFSTQLDSLKTDLQSIKQLPMVSMNLGYNKNVIP